MGGMTGPLVGRALCDGALVAALLFIFGLAFFILEVAPGAPYLEDHITALWMVLRLLVLIQCLMWPIKLLFNVASMAGVAVRQALPFVPEVLRETHFGHDWLVGAPLALAMLPVAWKTGRASMRAGLLMLISAGLMVLWAASSHAIDAGLVAVAAYSVHEAAAGLWAGSLLGISLMAWRDRLDRKLVESASKRVSTLAGWCVAALIVSGAYLAYNAMGIRLYQLLHSTYGQVLLVKICLFGVIVGIGGYNRYRLIPGVGLQSPRKSLLRNVGIECLLLIVVIGLAALLANTPPAHSHLTRG